MSKRKFFKPILIVLIFVFGFLAVMSAVSYTQFGVIKPVSSTVALLRVSFSDTPLVEIQKDPPVMVVKPSSNQEFYKAMEEKGYRFLADEQMGSLIVFEKDGKKFSGFFNHGRISSWVCSDVRE